MEVRDKVEIFDSFLSPKDCRQLIKRAESIGFEDAYIISDGQKVFAKEIRNNQRVILDDVDLAADIWRKIQLLICLETEGWAPVGLN